MNYTKQEALDYIYDNDVRFVKLQFCDALGFLKNISIQGNTLASAFDNGIYFSPSRLDYMGGDPDYEVLLKPDPSTLSVLPWRQSGGNVVRFLCDLVCGGGQADGYDSRAVLKKQLARAASLGYSFEIGVHSDFYLFETDHEGNFTINPMDKASFYDAAPVDMGENVRRDICLTLDEMGYAVENSFHQSGPGQHRICFKGSDALKSADDFLTFRAVVKTVAGRDGLHASFMPKPFSDCDGSNLRINMTVKKDGKNIFEAPSGESEAFIAGILSHACANSTVTNPTVNSYKRLALHKHLSLKADVSDGKSSYIRINANKHRLEFNTPDATCNPYLAYALLIAAGLDGVENKTVLHERAVSLPASLSEAVGAFKRDSFVNSVLGDAIYKTFVSVKQTEWKEYMSQIHKWETDSYIEKY